MGGFRRFAAGLCLASLFSGQVAQAKSLIVYAPNTESFGAGTSYLAAPQLNRNLRAVASIIALTGGQVSLVKAQSTKSEWLRLGQGVWGSDAGQYVEQFDATILIDQFATAGIIRTDSVAKFAAFQGGSAHIGLAKPMLILRTNGPAIGSAGGVVPDSTNGGAVAFDSGPGKAVHFADDHLDFLTSAYTVSAQNLATKANVRRILFTNIPQADYRISNGTNSGATLGCRNCDSLMNYAANDSCVLWDKNWSVIFPAQASTITFASPWGSGGLADSIGNTVGEPRDPPTEGDWAILLCALAHLDSLSGHKVLGDKTIRIAPVVYGGLARDNRHSWNWNKSQGINDADTSSFYAFLDSLASRPDIKITFAVNVDSATTYARDIIKMKGITQARFTPQVWDGINDTSLTAYAGFPKDIFGRYNRRAAYGDSATHALYNGGSDSSIYWQLKRAKAMCDSLFGGRTSKVLAAPADDWSPKQLLGAFQNGGGITIDSVMYAMQLAGFTGIIADAQDPDANASKTNSGPSKTNPRGYYNRQQLFSSGSISGLRNFKILCHSGFNIMGGRSQAECFSGPGAGSGTIDSSSSPPRSFFVIYKELGRLWSSNLLAYDESMDLFPYDDPQTDLMWIGNDILHRKVDVTQAQRRSPIKHGNIVRLSCGDLSGASGSGIVPAATMWHVLKAAANAMYVINKLAGRTVVTFDYPENIDP